MKGFFICILLFFAIPVIAQQPRIFSFTVKAGASFGGSQPGSFRENKSANLMLDFSGGIGLGIHFTSAWQACLDLNYIRKGVNCPLAYVFQTDDLSRSAAEEQEVYGWFNNAYLEIPFTIGYTWGYDICRTRLGVYYARRLATRSKLIINGRLIEQDNRHSAVYDLYEQHLSDDDYGIKIANEFYFNSFSIGLEFSTGFRPTIQSAWRVSDSQSYTMAICFYAGYRF